MKFTGLNELLVIRVCFIILFLTPALYLYFGINSFTFSQYLRLLTDASFFCIRLNALHLVCSLLIIKAYVAA